MNRSGLSAFLLFFAFLVSPSLYAKVDQLPSWNEGVVKKSILEFVQKVTTPNSSSYVAPAERIATFDNDGTLWQEKPMVQGAFMAERLKRLVAADKSLLNRNSVRLAIKEGLGAFGKLTHEEIVELLILTNSGLSQARYDAEAREFIKSARHPRWKRPYTELTYKPMLELMRLLQHSGFKVYVVSGGGSDFMRQIPAEVYGIAPANYVGSSFFKEMRDVGGVPSLWILPKVRAVNDKSQKPLNIDLQIGQRPIFAAGNVGGGGDIAMLSYSKQSPGASLQLLVNHDDVAREFAYVEESGESLTAAAKQGFLVISMKEDWREIFEKQPIKVK